MKRSASRFSLRRRSMIRRAVFLAAAALAAVPITHANAATIAVTNCANSGAGSLRNAASVAASGDVIDMTGLACNRILLGSTITFPQNSITLRGPGRLALTVSAGESGRVFAHTGSGTLRVERLSVAWGRLRSVSAFGGCIYSAASLELIRSSVHHCRALQGATLEPRAAGGAVFAGKVLLSDSIVSDSYAENGPGGGVFAGYVTVRRSQIRNNGGAESGGAVHATRSLLVTDSLIHNNRAGSGGAFYGSGEDFISMVIKNSTISGNQAGSGGAIWGGGRRETRIISSTISGNSAYSSGAAWLYGFTFVVGSTIAFNESWQDDQCSFPLVMFSPYSLLVGSIVARNTCQGGTPADVWVVATDDGAVLPGGRNLIGVADGPVPGDTIFGNPLLGPLANNGGPTPTHLPASNSPVIDKGASVYFEIYDQRGPGFRRIKGANPDIGAVER